MLIDVGPKIFNALWSRRPLPAGLAAVSEWCCHFQSPEQLADSAMLDLLARLCEVRSSMRKRRASAILLLASDTCAELKKIDLELQDWEGCYPRTTNLSTGLSRKLEASRLDYVTTRLMVNQHIRDELCRLPGSDVEADVSSLCLPKTLDTIVSLRKEIFVCVRNVLQPDLSRTPSLARQRTAIWPLFVVGSDLQTPVAETERTLSQLNNIASTSGLEAASRLATAIARNVQRHPM